MRRFFLLFALLLALLIPVESVAGPFMVLPKRGSAWSGGAWKPTDVAGCVIAMEADQITASDNDPIGTWADQSGNGNDLIQATADDKPLYKTNILNGKPALLFDGASDFMATAGAVQLHTVFVVAKYNAELFANYVGLISYTGSFGNRVIMTGQSGSANWYAAEGTYNRYMDGVDTDSDVTNAFHIFRAVQGSDDISETIEIGKDRNQERYWSGYYVAVYGYSGAVSVEDTAAIEGYLKTKYGTP